LYAYVKNKVYVYENKPYGMFMKLLTEILIKKLSFVLKRKLVCLPRTSSLEPTHKLFLEHEVLLILLQVWQ